MLKFNIRNQQLSRVDSFRPVEKSVNYLTASFSFLTKDWEGCTKKATCKNVTTGKHYDAEIENDTCLIPWEALTDKGSFEISVRGTNGETTITTSTITVDLGRTLPTSTESNPPTPTELDLIWKAVGNLDDLRTDSKENLVAAVNSLIGQGGNVDFTGVVRSVNGVAPDENGNVEITLPDSGGNVDLTGIVKSVNGQTPDENGNVEIDASRPTDEQVQTAVRAYLEEHPVSGISATASALLINILRNAVYTADQSAYITALENALFSGGTTPDEPDKPVVTTYTIVSALLHATSNNASASVESGASYTATITADDGYTLDGATVSVNMGGVDITATAYANGVVNIASVTGNVIITVNAVALVASDILYQLASPITFDGTNGIDTGLMLHDEDKDFSILIDLTGTATETDFIERCLINSRNATAGSSNAGFDIRTGSSKYCHSFDGYANNTRFGLKTDTYTSEIVSVKIVMTHVKGSNEIVYSLRDVGASGTVKTTTITDSTVFSKPHSGTFGLCTTLQNNFAGVPCTVHEFAIYNRVLSDEEITEFFA